MLPFWVNITFSLMNVTFFAAVTTFFDCRTVFYFLVDQQTVQKSKNIISAPKKPITFATKNETFGQKM